MPKLATVHQFNDIADAFFALVPAYKSKSYGPLVFSVKEWWSSMALDVASINPKRAADRIKNYVNPFEVERASQRIKAGKSASIRFGVAKEGRGYHGERADFCLIGGAVDGKHLAMFYRSLELIGGLAYDLSIIRELQVKLGVPWKTVTFYTANASVFALKGNSNQALYPKLCKIMGDYCDRSD
jgi:hypothetical protein